MGDKISEAKENTLPTPNKLEEFSIHGKQLDDILLGSSNWYTPTNYSFSMQMKQLVLQVATKTLNL